MSGHTPGPWWIGEENIISKSGYVVGAATDLGEPVMVFRKNEDAHLIAAAPDMYEALQFYARQEAYYGPNRRNDGTDPFTDENDSYIVDVTRDNGDRARAAIAKAEGR